MSVYQCLRHFAVALLICGVSALNAHANDTVELYAQLLEKSGLNAQINQLSDNILLGVQQQFPAGDPATDDVINSLQQAYNAAGLRARIKDYLQQNLSIADLQQVLVWLESDTGRKITQLEVLSTAPEQQQAAEAAYAELAKNTQRKAMLAELDKATACSDTALNITLAIRQALLRSLLSGNAQASQLLKMQQSQAEAMRATMASEFRVSVEKSYLHTYRNLSDAELRAYLDFAQSTVAQKYHQVVSRAVLGSLVIASYAAGEELQQRSASLPAANG